MSHSGTYNIIIYGSPLVYLLEWTYTLVPMPDANKVTLRSEVVTNVFHSDLEI